MSCRNKKISVIGLGLSGLAAADYLLNLGARVTGVDRKPPEELGPELQPLLDKGLSLSGGGRRDEAFTRAELIVVSPGVPLTLSPLKKARALGTPIIGELELAATSISAPILALTGSNGKTTATSLCGDILKRAGRRVFVGGNIGNPLINLARSGEEVEAAVVEASSFQLETVKRFKAEAAAILNISPDHLDRYTDMAEYFRAKSNIFNNQTAENWAVLNEDDLLLQLKSTAAERIGFSRLSRLAHGLYLDNGFLKMALKGQVVAEKPWSEFRLWGAHNQENVMAAVALTVKAGLEPQKALDLAAEFRGLPHRIEFVGEYDGVKYYDDSKGTNVGAVIRALDNFSTPVVLIAGGRDKYLDFRPLYEPVKKRVKALILIGEAKGVMSRILSSATRTVAAESMAEAVSLARREARPGEAVLLSPACASFDMFKDYKDRGEAFAREARLQAGG